MFHLALFAIVFGCGVLAMTNVLHRRMLNTLLCLIADAIAVIISALMTAAGIH